MSDPVPAPASNLMYDVRSTDVGASYSVGIEQVEEIQSRARWEQFGTARA